MCNLHPLTSTHGCRKGVGAVHAVVTRGRCSPSNVPQNEATCSSVHIITLMFYYQVFKHSCTEHIWSLTASSC